MFFFAMPSLFRGGFVFFSHFFFNVFAGFSDLSKNNSHLLLVILNCYIYL